MRGCAALLGLGFLAASPSQAGQPVPAPDFALPALDGQNYRLSEQRGEVVALVFWASWCGGCREQLALLRDLQTLYRDWGLRVMAVSLDDDRRKAESVVKSLGLQYPVMHDRDKAVSRDWDPHRLPATYLLDRTGAVRYAQQAGDGPPETKELVARMRALLDE
jgi:peroxiredoxin